MKNIFIIFLTTMFGALLIAGCGNQLPPTATATATSKPTITHQATATFLPTFTPAPIVFVPTATLTPLPKDIFDNFQGLSGNCKINIANGTTPRDEKLLEFYLANVSIDFDRKGYLPGDLIKLSASVNENYLHSERIHGIVVKVVVEEPTLKRHSFYLYDDGTHGDEKADDGIYANTFENTLNIGIYKFYFQLSSTSLT